MQLYLMRHGEAVPVGGAITEDTHRPLSARGKEQVRAVGEGLKRRLPPGRQRLDLIVSSPLIRARETARVMADVLDAPRVETSPLLAPNASPAPLLSFLTADHNAQHVLWVGHHPDVTLWTAFLAGLDSSVCPLFGTASVAALQIDPASRKAELLWFQTADQFAHP